MSMVPMMGNKPSFNPEVFARDENVGIAYGMGLTAEKVAAQWKINREDQDAFALQSHHACAGGHPGRCLCRRNDARCRWCRAAPDLAGGSVNVKARTVSIDEGPRPDTSLEGLAKLKPVFAAKGSVTAGNSSQTS
jgi:acetyl-CoA acyltransferase